VDKLVRKITIDITTSFAKGAGTDGQAFLGLGGREFRLDIADHEDFERGDETTYELGEGSNVVKPERNDPRVGLPITLDDVLAHPVYLRLVPDDKADDWNLANIRVKIQAGHEIVRYRALEGPQENIWLGYQSGTWLHLKRAPNEP
jgi:hypothetical protein